MNEVLGKPVEIKIQIVDDHPSIHYALAALLGRRHTVVAQALTAAEAINQVEDHPIDVVILDLTLPDKAGEMVLDFHRRKKTNIPVLIYTGSTDQGRLRACLRKGARGLVWKAAPVEELLHAIEKIVIHREIYLGNGFEVLGKRLTGRKNNSLTRRETELAQAIAKGWTSRKIAEYLGISMATVNIHRTNLMKKLNVRDSAGVTRHAIREGLIERD